MAELRDVLRRAVQDPRPAVLTIDLHRGHLDPEVATIPLLPDRAARVVEANWAFLAQARSLSVPVVHMLTEYRDNAEIMSNPFWRGVAGSGSTRSRQEGHNLAGSPGAEMMPGIVDEERDRVLRTKKRYDCFLATDLEFVLRTLGVNVLYLTGVNTNSCVLATTIEGSVRDFACVVVSDCVDSMDGSAVHESALELTRLAFGWVATSDEALAAMAGT